MPVPSEELPILERLIVVRNRLTALKKDRKEYIKSADVLQLYDVCIKLVTKLNDIRENNADTATSNSIPLPETEVNRVDQTFSDVFQLLSLFFLTSQSDVPHRPEG
jgi:hypothetical protein